MWFHLKRSGYGLLLAARIQTRESQFGSKHGRILCISAKVSGRMYPLGMLGHNHKDTNGDFHQNIVLKSQRLETI